MDHKMVNLVLTILIPESTANESIPPPPCLSPGYASQNARTRVSAKVWASKMMTESPEVYIYKDPGFSTGTGQKLRRTSNVCWGSTR